MQFSRNRLLLLKYQNQQVYEQLDLFTDIKEKLKQDEKLQKEKKLQETVIGIKNKYGKNAIIKAFNLEEGATTLSRNRQIGGHSE